MRRAFLLSFLLVTSCKDDEPDLPPGIAPCLECKEDAECPGYLNYEVCSDELCTRSCAPDESSPCIVPEAPGFPGGTQVGTCQLDQDGKARCIDDERGNVCLEHME